MTRFLNWLDDRTGYRAAVHATLYEHIPGGARWRYIWGSTLVFTFFVQLVTGLFLGMAYSPSAQTAWESVYYIQHEMQFGWLLRGLHHFTAHAMVVLLALHLMQVIIDGAYRAPREVNFWLGLMLMLIVLGLSLTGYLLPWDQKGYWATQVATTLSSIVPEIGPSIQRLIVGGPNYGHHTLTRFFAMHAGVLPALLVGFLALHIYVFRRHGITVKEPHRRPAATFWPDQVLRDSVACLGVLLVVLLLVLRNAPHEADEWRRLADDQRLGDVLGAALGAPADPSEPYSAARPEWYFLFLFQFLKYFPRETEIYGAVVIPGVVIGVMFLMPFIGRWKLGHRFNVAYIFCLMAGIGALTAVAINEDNNGPQSEKYKLAVRDADAKARRVVELIQGRQGISGEGAVAMLRSDPKTHGPELFAKNCAQCHRYDAHDGTGTVPDESPQASDLGQFGTREWIRGFIENPAGPKHFGPTAQGFTFDGKPIGTRFTEGAMATFVAKNVGKMQKREIDAVVEFLVAQSGRDDIPPPDPELVKAGRQFFELGNDNLESTCIDCHSITVAGESLESSGYADAPELTNYASEEWLRDFLLDPGAQKNYGERNAMPSYKNRMTDKDLEILLRWMRHRWYEPPAGS